MLDTRHITEHFTVMSGNTVSGLAIKIRFSCLYLPFNPRTTDRKLLKPSASKPSSPKVFPRPTSASNHHKHPSKKRICVDHQNAFLHSPRQRRQACSQRNRLRLTGRCGELHTYRGLPAFWAMEPKGT